MTPSRLLRTSGSARADRDALYERLGVVKAGLLLLASLPDNGDCEKRPDAAPPGKTGSLSASQEEKASGN